MTGAVDFDLPAYTVAGQTINLVAGGIIAPSGVEWSWYSRSLQVTDTVYGPKLTVVIPDRIGEDTLMAYARKTGYYTSSSVKYTEVIDPVIGGKSVEGILSGDYVYTDERDGSQYPVVKYGNLEWFTLNLHYAGEDGSLGTAYQHSDPVDGVFGRLYSWNEATGGVKGSGLGGGPQGACPDGWSVPTEDDWTDFANAVRPASVTEELKFDDRWNLLASDISAEITINGKKMWEYSPDNVQTNLHRWNAIPAGKSANGHNTFGQMLSYGFWWVSDLTSDGEKAIFRYIYWDDAALPYSVADKDNVGFSVRCVKKL